MSHNRAFYKYVLVAGYSPMRGKLYNYNIINLEAIDNVFLGCLEKISCEQKAAKASQL